MAREPVSDRPQVRATINVVAGIGNNGGAVGYPARFATSSESARAGPEGALCSFSNRGDGLDSVGARL